MYSMDKKVFFSPDMILIWPEMLHTATHLVVKAKNGKLK